MGAHGRFLGSGGRVAAVSLLTLVWLFVSMVCYSQAAIVTIGVDWGEEYVEVSIGFRGHKPDILLNDTGSRKFVNAVSLDGNTRSFDQKAVANVVKKPGKTVHHAAHMLGLDFPHMGEKGVSPVPKGEVDGLMRQNGVLYDEDYMPYEFGSDANGQMYLKLTKDSMVKMEEVAGHFFSYIKDIVISKLINAKVMKPGEADPAIVAVISIPCNYTQRQRKAITFAAESAGITVEHLIHGVTAASVMRAFEHGPGVKKILFYDLGSSGANVGVVEIIVPEPQGTNANKETQIHVLSCVHEPGVGGRHHDVVLAEHLRSIFEKKNGVNLMPEHPQALQKLLKAANKAKVALTISEQTAVAIEGLTRNMDFEREIITREVFNNLIQDSINRLNAPLEMALERAGGINLAELDGVELIGGAWRVPAVQKKLAEILNPHTLGFHLNAEEAMAMGCGYLAAPHNPFFKMKAANIIDNSVHLYTIRIASISSDNENGVEKKTHLFKPESKLQGLKSIVFKIGSDFTLELKENEKIIAVYNVTGITDEMAKAENMGKVAKVTLVFRPDNMGIIGISKAAAIVQPSEDEDPSLCSPSTEEATPDATESSTTEAEKTEEKEEEKPVEIDIKLSLAFENPFSSERLEECKNAIMALRQRDIDLTRRAEKKNTLESLIYKYKSASRQSKFKAACDEETFSTLQELLEKYEQWFDDESYDADLQAFEERITQLEAVAQPRYKRWMDNEARPSLVESTDKQMERMENNIESLLQKKPYLSEKVITIESWKEVKTWWEEVKREQESLLPHQEPAFTAEMVKLKLAMAREAVTMLENTPEPKESSQTSEKQTEKESEDQEDEEPTETDYQADVEDVVTQEEYTTEETQEDSPEQDFTEESEQTEQQVTGHDDEL